MKKDAPKSLVPDPTTRGSFDQQPRAIPQPDRDENHNVLDLHAAILREQAEPRDGFEPIPLWLTFVFGAIIFWAGYYLASFNGGFRVTEYDERRTGAGESLAKSATPPDPLVLGKRLYTANCAACHQPTGLGVSGQFPPLAESEWVVGEPAMLKSILLHGLQGPVKVKGQTYNGNMPAFGARLSDDQLSLVLTFIRQGWGNAAGPITPESIASPRKAFRDRTNAWSESELKALPPDTVAPEKSG